MQQPPAGNLSQDDLAREVRVLEALEFAEAPIRVSGAMLAALIVITLQLGTGFIIGPAGIPLAVLVILNGLGLYSCLKLRGRPRPTDISRRRLRNMLITSAILGLAWGALVAILLPRIGPDDQVLVICVAFATAFGSLGINSPRTAMGFAIPLLAMLWAAIIWLGLLNWISATAMVAGFTGTIVYFSLMLRARTVQSTRLVMENALALETRLAAEERLRAAEAEAAAAEQERQKQIARTQRALINAIAFPMVLSHGNDVLEVTAAARRQFGVSEGPTDRLEVSRFFVNLQDQADMIVMLERDGQIDDHEVLMRNVAGEQFWTVMSMRPLEYEGKACWLNAIWVIDTRKRMEQDLAAAKHDAETALADLRRAQDSLVHAEKMASLGQLTAGIAHEIKNPLNFVNNFSKLSAEMMDELAEVLEKPLTSMSEADRDDAEDLIATVRDNLVKIDEHGRRADSIVKNMLMHSREGGGETQNINVNAIAQEAMNLAYHGARAADSSFNVEIESDFSPDVGTISGQPQELQRVFLNLCSNGMYAAVKRAADGGNVAKLSIRSRVDGDTYLVEVNDNGAGVPADIRDKIFQPFFTTKPTGEGTGLGLSMSYDIVKQHGGSIELHSEADIGTTFRVRLPAA